MAKTYKNCARVPANESMNECKPRYVSPFFNDKSNASSNNWGLCNMKNWYTKTSKKHKYYKQFCNNKKSKLIKSKKTNSVDVIKLHNKMPYIWRFLKPKTRKHMIELAKKPIKQINIPFSLFPDNIKNMSSNKTLKMYDKTTRKKIYNLRKKYKNI
tara:strand:+ start:23228 stop:23695 length:468 start_codon:yes stop_codon:yes gene_type:complete